MFTESTYIYTVKHNIVKIQYIFYVGFLIHHITNCFKEAKARKESFKRRFEPVVDDTF